MVLKTLKKAMVALFAAAMVVTTAVLPALAAESEFTDVVAGEWYEGSVERWDDADIINGYTDENGKPSGEFGTHDPITRGQMATILTRILGLTHESTESAFTDVDEDIWYFDGVMACYEAGIVNGYTDGNGVPNGLFGPEDPITREQAFAMSSRALKLVDNQDEAAVLEGFADGSDVSPWAVADVATVVSYKAVNGRQVEGGAPTLSPQDDITRAEVTTILDRLIAVYVDKDGNVSKASNAEAEDASKLQGTVVVINAAQKENVAVDVNKDETTGEVTIAVTVTKEDGTTASESLNVSAENAATQTPVLVHGTSAKDDIVNSEEDVVVDGDHKFVWTNCAVAETPVYNCPVCGPVEGEPHEAQIHEFDENGQCTKCIMTEDDAMKFNLTVSSISPDTNTEEYVAANVTNDYAATVTVTPGTVNAGKATLTATMKDVASLGAAGVTKSHTLDITTGMDKNPDLSVWLSNAFTFKDATVQATIQDKPATYNLTGNMPAEGENAVITAVPSNVDETRAAWAELTSEDHLTTATVEGEGNSYVVVANGSYMVVGDDKLSFEKAVEDDLVLDNLSTSDGLSALETEIRSKVKLSTVKADETYEATFFLAAGTELAVSNSVATLTDDCLITLDGLDGAALDSVLPDLQAAQGSYAIASNLVNLLNEMILSVDEGENVFVDITFTEPKTSKFYLGVTAANVEDPTKTTTVDMEVFNDYSLEINVPMNNISAANVALDVVMTDVASLGAAGTTKSHHLDIATGMTQTGDLSTWMANAATFGNATVNVDMNGVAGCTYELVGDQDAEWATITGTTNTEEARAAWAELTSHITSGANPAGDDSYVVIDKDSYVNVYGESLVFEEGKDNLTLNNFNNLDGLKATIKDHVMVGEGDGTIKLYAGAGTTLAVSSSAATLKDNALIEIEISNGNEKVAIPSDLISQIRDAANAGNSQLVKKLFETLNALVGHINGATVNVTITFSPDVVEEAPAEPAPEAVVVEEVVEETAVVEEEVVVEEPALVEETVVVE